MKYKLFAFAFLLFAILFVMLESLYKYHFFFIEQNQMFLFTGYYFTELLSEPGGLANYIAEFLVQFFTLPYMGSLITALLLSLSALLTGLICKRMAPTIPLYLLYILPALSLLCIHFDYYYFYQGTIAFLMMQGLFLLYVSFRKYAIRLCAAAAITPLLFWWGGPIAVLFALCVVIWEVANKSSKWYLSLLVGIEAVLIAYGSVYLSIFGEYSNAFTPKLYYMEKLIPGKEIYFAWISMPLLLIVAGLFRKLQKPTTARKEIIITASQLVLIIVVMWIGVSTYIDNKSYKLKKLDHYARSERWDEIINECKGTLDNFLFLNYLNLALAQKGMLADELFKYDQRGINGLFIPWNRTQQPSIILSDVHFCIGNSAISQELAFESYQCAPGFASPRSFMRMIQTNIVLGYYPIAEKYLDMLEQTLFYDDWAKEHRKFLYNDELVDKDPLFGKKRESLVDNNYLANPHIVAPDLMAIAYKNPSNKTAIEYLGSLLLLGKDMNAFRDLLETSYGTERLPVLPHSFQEAVFSLYEHNPEMWEHYNIAPDILNRFNEYKRQVLANKNNRGVANILRRPFGDTYWFYYMFK